jgi:hypothetical protein
VEGQGASAAIEFFHRDKCRQNAEPAVVFPGILHGVVMRADHQRARARIGRGEAADDIAHGVDHNGHSG